MDRKTYRKCVMGIALAIGFVVGFSVTRGNIVLPLAAVLGGIALLYVCKRKVKGVIEDERIYKISEKASRRTVQVIGMSAAVLGLGLIGLSRSGYVEMEQAGFTLAYFAAALLVVYMVFYWYYGRKYGD